MLVANIWEGVGSIKPAVYQKNLDLNSHQWTD